MTERKQFLPDYFAALERLKVGRPLRVPKGMRISKDAVALEAGRSKGSIKKSRPVFDTLIAEIDVAAEAQSIASPEQQQKVQLERVKDTANQHRKDLDTALASLVARLVEVHELKKKVRTLEGEVQELKDRLARVSKEKTVKLKRTPI